MKPLAASLCLLTALAWAQKPFTYEDANTTLRGVHALMTLQGPTYHFDLQGSVSIKSKSQGFSLNAGRVVADVLPGKGKGSEAQIKQATATGGVHIDQAVAGAAGKRSTIDSSKAVYVAQGPTGRVTMSGAVRIVSIDSQRRTMVATGSSGVALLDMKAKSERGLRSGTLNGPVTVDIQENAQGAHIVAKGERLDIDNSSRPATLTLVGHVTIHGQGKSTLGSLNSVSQLVITLNDKGEFQSMRFKS